MPKVGDKEFAYTPEGIAEAEAYAESAGIPMSNAMERSESYQLGGAVQPPTAPSMPQYKEGGKVESMSKGKTGGRFQGSSSEVAAKMKRDPSFKAGMEKHYGLTLGEKNKLSRVKSKGKK